MAHVQLFRPALGHVMFHGTNDAEPFDALRDTAWVTDSLDTARWFTTWKNHQKGRERGPRRILHLAFVDRPRLRIFWDRHELGAYLRRRGNDRTYVEEALRSWDADTLASLFLASGHYDGWHLPQHYSHGLGGSDTMISSARRWLVLHGVEWVDPRPADWPDWPEIRSPAPTAPAVASVAAFLRGAR